MSDSIESSYYSPCDKFLAIQLWFLISFIVSLSFPKFLFSRIFFPIAPVTSLVLFRRKVSSSVFLCIWEIVISIFHKKGHSKWSILAFFTVAAMARHEIFQALPTCFLLRLKTLLWVWIKFYLWQCAFTWWLTVLCPCKYWQIKQADRFVSENFKNISF